MNEKEKQEFTDLVFDGGALLRSQDDGDGLAHRRFLDWDQHVANWIRRTLQEKPQLLADWGKKSFPPNPESTLAHDFRYRYEKAVRDRLDFLNQVAGDLVAPSAPGKRLARDKPAGGNKVFIVHGRDEGTRESVARFVQKLGCEPIILHEQASAGNTLMEKLFASSDAAFAIVLLTGDDRGGSAASQPDSYQLRARQNVIFEHGLFLGLLGRQAVCSLYERGVELPSDLGGIAYIELEGDWKLTLAREMKEAGLPVDMNNAV